MNLNYLILLADNASSDDFFLFITFVSIKDDPFELLSTVRFITLYN